MEGVTNMKNLKASFGDKMNPHGKVYRRVFSGTELKMLLEKRLNISFNVCYDAKGILDFDMMCERALKSGLANKELSSLLDKAAKKQFADNFIWRFLKRAYNIDLAIPFITGYYTKGAVKGNLVVNTGHKAYADQIGGTTTTPVTAMAYGTGAVAAAAGDTALGAEVARGAATVTNTTTTTTGDTEQWVKTFTAGGTQAITEEGLFDNNTSGGKLLARQVFAAINMVLNDTVQFTHKIQS